MDQLAQNFLQEASFGTGSELATDLAKLQEQMQAWLSRHGYWDPVMALDDKSKSYTTETATVVSQESEASLWEHSRAMEVLSLRQMRIRQRLPQVAVPQDAVWCLNIKSNLTFELFKQGGSLGLELYGTEILTCVRDIAQSEWHVQGHHNEFEVLDCQANDTDYTPVQMSTADVLMLLQNILSPVEESSSDEEYM